MKVKVVKKNKIFSLDNPIMGKEYVVLMIEYNRETERRNQNFIYYRIVSETGTMYPYSSDHFEVLDNRIPDNWIFKKETDFYSTLMPKEFDYDGFLENYYDGDKKALDIVKEQLDKLTEKEQNIYDIVKKIINEWDPMFLIESYQLDMNYETEISQIVKGIEDKNITMEISSLISNAFDEKYDDFVISKTKEPEECERIAKIIINEMGKNN